MKYSGFLKKKKKKKKKKSTNCPVRKNQNQGITVKNWVTIIQANQNEISENSPKKEVVMAKHT